MKMTAVLVTGLLLAGMAGTVLAEEKTVRVEVDSKADCCESGDKSVLVCRAGDAEEGECHIIKVNAGDGEKRIIKVVGDDVTMLGEELDRETHSKLLDEQIVHVQATGPLRTDLAVKKLELARLKLAETPDQSAVRAKEREVEAAQAQLKAKQEAHEAALRKLLPEGSRELLLLDSGLDLLDEFDLPGDGARMKKVIRICKDDKDCRIILESE